MADNILMGVDAVQSIIVADLKPGKGRCLATAYVSKQLLLDLLPEEASKIFDCTVVLVLREVTASHAAFRERCEEKLDCGTCCCVDGCATDCPCSAEGIGCWFDPYDERSCGCQGRCKAASAGYVYDELAIQKARRAALRRVAKLGL